MGAVDARERGKKAACGGGLVGRGRKSFGHRECQKERKEREKRETSARLSTLGIPGVRSSLLQPPHVARVAKNGLDTRGEERRCKLATDGERGERDGPGGSVLSSQRRIAAPLAVRTERGGLQEGRDGKGSFLGGRKAWLSFLWRLLRGGEGGAATVDGVQRRDGNATTPSIDCVKGKASRSVRTSV